MHLFLLGGLFSFFSLLVSLELLVHLAGFGDAHLGTFDSHEAVTTFHNHFAITAAKENFGDSTAILTSSGRGGGFVLNNA